MSTSVMTDETVKPQSNLGPLSIIAALFFIFGFITWQNGALVPYLQMVCQLTETQALMVASAFYLAFTLVALPSAAILEKTGYKNGIVYGLLTIVVGFLLYIPAAKLQAFWLFIIAQFVIGSALTLLQTAANPYVVKVGPIESASVRIMFMGLMNKGAGVIVPVLFTAVVLGGFSDVTTTSLAAMSEAERQQTIDGMANGLVNPYIGMAVLFVFLAFLMKKVNLPELDLDNDSEGEDATHDASGKDKTSIMQFPHLILGALTIWVYVGVEVIAGDTIGLFGSNLGVPNATSLTSYTMGFMLVGYALGIALIPRLISQEFALKASAVTGIIFSLLVVYGDNSSYVMSEILWGWTGIPTLPDTITCIALLGFSNAVVWPAVWPLALEGLGRFTSKGSALLIMGISGGAVLPLVYGLLSESIDGQSAYWMMVPIYIFILFYAVKGHKIKSWGNS